MLQESELNIYKVLLSLPHLRLVPNQSCTRLPTPQLAMLVVWALHHFVLFGMRLIVLVGSQSTQKHQDSKSQECGFPFLESVRCNINREL